MVRRPRTLGNTDFVDATEPRLRKNPLHFCFYQTLMLKLGFLFLILVWGFDQSLIRNYTWASVLDTSEKKFGCFFEKHLQKQIFVKLIVYIYSICQVTKIKIKITSTGLPRRCNFYFGQQTGYFLYNKNFLLDFSFSVTRPKTKNAKLPIRYCWRPKKFKNTLRKIFLNEVSK